MWRDNLKQLVYRPLRPVRPLVQWYRQGRFIASKLWRYGELVPPSYYIFADRMLIYISVPKVACTSIKTTIGRAYQIEVQDELDIHDHEAWRYGVGKPPKGEYAIFTFVRNPYARLVSCYRDKVIDTKQTCSTPYFMKRPGYYYPYQIPATFSFEQFVKRIIKIPDRLADNHFKSQYAILSRRGQILPDFIGHLETIEQDWAKIAIAYHFDVRFARTNSTSPSESKAGYAAYYTPELADLVYKRYQQDFEQLGYSHARQELLEMLTSDECNGQAR